MPVVPCPNCKTSTPSETQTPDFATAHYYRCHHCGHMWTADKLTDQVREHVTDLNKAPDWFDPPPHDD